MSIFDFNNLPPDYKGTISVEREETKGERSVRLGKEVAVFVLAIGYAMMITWLCYSTLVSAQASAEEKKWAMSVLSGAAGGVIGYLLRR